MTVILKKSTSLRVANLANLFGDNGSFKYPNTYPKLIDGVYVNKTPVMTSPTTGGVILEGDGNYCEFNQQLFFLKKSHLISQKRNKGMYVLIKDHICSLFKNHSGVKASGTLINSNLKKLSSDDFQYTFPVFNNYNKRILIPLTTEKYNGKRHAEVKKIIKTFDGYCPLTDVEFSNFVTGLEGNNDILTSGGKKWEDVIKDNKNVVIFGALGAKGEQLLTSKCDIGRKVKGWKQELVEKINEFVSTFHTSEDVTMGIIDHTVISGATKLNGKFAISYENDNPLFRVSTNDTHEIDVDLSGLTDIELINMDSPSSMEKYTKDQFNLFLSYDLNKVTHNYRMPDEEREDMIYELTRKVRSPLFHKNTSRAIIKFEAEYPDELTGVKRKINLHKIFYSDGQQGGGRLYDLGPQKIFIKVNKPLTLKSNLDSKIVSQYPNQRYGNSYRSVYLYGCGNLDFHFVGSGGPKESVRDGIRMDFVGTAIPREEPTGIEPTDYFPNQRTQNVNRSISGNTNIVVHDFRSLGVAATSSSRSNDYYIGVSDYPWSKLKKPINIGGQLGQVSSFIEGQENLFEVDYPFIVRTGVSDGQTLKRLKGFKEIVGKLVHGDNIYDLNEYEHKFTLDCFGELSHRHRQKTEEEDFLIGEKLLFTTGGMAPYLLFQPGKHTFKDYGSSRGDSAYTYFTFTDLDDDDGTAELFGKGIDYYAGHYAYVVFDSGSYFKQHAKQGYKKAYDSFRPLEYQRFYSSDESYKKLEEHVKSNTEAYFEFDEIPKISETPLKELKVGDVFYSTQEGGGSQKGKAISVAKAFVYEPFYFYGYGMQNLLDRMTEEDLVVYLNPKDKKIYIGSVYVWNSRMTLPNNQFIATSLDESKSDKNTLDVTYIRFTPAQTDRVASFIEGFNSLEECVNALKRPNYVKKRKPNSLQELRDSGRDYLFNLKGTPFFCYYDRKGKVSLIFKNKEKYSSEEYIPN